jgi:hypothetical protein
MAGLNQVDFFFHCFQCSTYIFVLYIFLKPVTVAERCLRSLDVVTMGSNFAQGMDYVCVFVCVYSLFVLSYI